jgi:mannosyltransferase
MGGPRAGGASDVEPVPVDPRERVFPARADRRTGVLLPIAAAVMTLVTGAIGLGAPSLWFDEAASISAAQRSPGELAALVRDIDIVHAAHYALLSGWVELFGIGEIAVRSLSLIALAVAAAGFVLFVQRFRGRLAAAVAGVLFVMLPGIAWSGAEARGYAFALAACTWALVALQSAISRGGWWRWAVYAALLVASAVFSIMTVLMVAAHVVYLVAVARVASRWRGFAVAWAAALLATLPLIVVASRQQAQLDWIDLDPARLAAKVGIGQLFLGPRDGGGITPALVSAAAAAVICAALGILALVAARGEARRSVLFALVWFAVPTLALALPVLVGLQLYQERYLLFAAPGACLLVAEGLLLLRSRGILAVVALGLLVATMIPPLVAQREEGSKAGDEYRALAAVGADAETVLYVVPTARGVGIAYPRSLGSATDATLRETPARSATLWGVDDPIDDGAAALSGRTAVYTPTGGGDEAAASGGLLERAGCEPTGRTHVAVRFTVVLYDCGRT